MKTEKEPHDYLVAQFRNIIIAALIGEGSDVNKVDTENWKFVISDCVHFCKRYAQSPAISRERLVEIMENNFGSASHLQGELFTQHTDECEAAADAILSELGAKAGQPPKPEPQPITMPTDEEQQRRFEAHLNIYLNNETMPYPMRPTPLEKKALTEGWTACWLWVKSEIEKRMKGGEG